MFVEPNDCIVELLNAPYDTTYASLLQFFHGLTVVDMLRTKNCITGNQSTILVMFSTMREKREALGRIGTELLGQRINMNRVFWRSSFYAADSGRKIYHLILQERFLTNMTKYMLSALVSSSRIDLKLSVPLP